MKNIMILLIFGLSSVFSNAAHAVGWTGEIENVRVWDTDKVEIFIKNPRNPNPAGSTWNCDYNIVLIGNPVKPSILSLALSSWVAGKSIRINVTGAGLSCATSYIQTINP